MNNPTPTPPTEKCCEKCREEVPGGRFMYFCAKDNDCPCHTTDKGLEERFNERFPNDMGSFDDCYLGGGHCGLSTKDIKDFIRREIEQAEARGRQQNRDAFTDKWLKEEYERGYHNGFKQGRFDTEMDTLNQPS